jgi:two-component system, chemotaxis family, CheB/CheR fusion protein
MGGESEREERDLGRLLEFIHEARGFDFAGYKRTSLRRRLKKRMGEVEVEGTNDYQDYLETNPDEFSALFDTVLINVTDFFRDSAAWSYLGEEVVGPLVRDGSDPVRVWCAGCATGEEAYTIAIVLAEAMGERAFRERVKIYATDADESALAHARHATYSSRAVKGVPADLLERYFEAGAQDYTFRADLRRSVIFGRNDLLQDAPISRVDLLLCRNTLMYFTAEAQSRILRRLNFALTERGFLFLGRSEILVAHNDLFRAHNLKWRVFQKIPGGPARERVGFPGGGAPRAGENGSLELHHELRGGAIALAPTAQILVGKDGTTAEINQRARELFGCSPTDIGRPFQDLALSYRPIDLRSAIERVYETGEIVTLSRVPWPAAEGQERVLEVEVHLVLGAEDTPLGVTISFKDITALTLLADAHEQRKRELEDAHEELQSTNEELETTNEELQSTNEELETTNEELQSTNEELETMNEELQSTNDELESLNREGTVRAGDLDKANLFLEGILTSLGVGVAVLDAERRVQLWNEDATELWGVRAEEAIGKAFGELDIGLPVRDLEAALVAALQLGGRTESIEVNAVNRRGKAISCRVRVLSLVVPGRVGREAVGAILLMSDGWPLPILDASIE